MPPANPKPVRSSHTAPAGDGLFAAAPPAATSLTPAARIACLRLIRSEGVGPATFYDLIAHTGTPEAALAALPELARRGGRTRPIRICTAAQAEAELEAAQRIGASVLFSIEPAYPVALAAVDCPPPLIYVKGDTGLLARPALAIVGSRQCSAAGHKLAGQFARALGEQGLVIASGLARGIDAAAHQAALTTGTIAVIAGGIDTVYPPEHADLQQRIAEGGCVVSEMPPGFKPRAQDFPRRNRIISGLSRGVLVIEAARRSGTLVTARLAGEQGREVFAVPGHPLDPRAEGTNQLLKSGATLVTTAEDVFEALRPSLGGGNDGFGISDSATGIWRATIPTLSFAPDDGAASAAAFRHPGASPSAETAQHPDYDPSREAPSHPDAPIPAAAFRHRDDGLSRQEDDMRNTASGTGTEAFRAHAAAIGASDDTPGTPGTTPRDPHATLPRSANPSPDTALPAFVSDAERARVLAALGAAPTEVDAVARATGLTIQSVHVALLELGLGGRIARYPGGLVALAPEALNAGEPE